MHAVQANQSIHCNQTKIWKQKHLTLTAAHALWNTTSQSGVGVIARWRAYGCSWAVPPARKLGTVSLCIEQPRLESHHNLCRGVFEVLQCVAKKIFGQLVQ